MPKHDSRIDAYILKSSNFALPILEHLRAIVHAACPSAEETMKWSFPHFIYKGEILCSMAAFKQHCVFGFWKQALMKDAAILINNRKEAMGSLGKLTSLKDLPSNKKLTGWIKEAMKLTDTGVKAEKKKAPEKNKKLTVPKYFLAALDKNKNAKTTFTNFNFTSKKEYVDWVTAAKTEITRDKRLAQAIEWMAEGKIRHWKYAR